MNKQGTITKFVSLNRCGFITPNSADRLDSSGDIFYHVCAVQNIRPKLLQIGQIVTYEQAFDETQNRWIATKVRIEDDGPPLAKRLRSGNRAVQQQHRQQIQEEDASNNSEGPEMAISDNHAFSVPKEVYGKVMPFLDLTSVARLGLASKASWRAYTSEPLWLDLLKRPIYNKASLRSCCHVNWNPPVYDPVWEAQVKKKIITRNGELLAEPLTLYKLSNVFTRPDGQGWRKWYIENFVLLKGIQGTYNRNKGLKMKLALNSFDILYTFSDETESSSISMKGKTTKWAGDHLVLRGKKTLWRNCQHRGKLRETRDEFCRVYFDVVNGRLGAHVSEFGFVPMDETKGDA